MRKHLPTFINHILTSVGWSNGKVRADHADDLVGLAATHFAEDFPNSTRADCPAPGTLARVISAGLLPSDELREHMLMCSECFAYYRQQLAHHRAPGSVAATGAALDTRRRRLAPILAGGLAGTFAVLAFLVIHNRDQRIGERASVNSAASPVSVPTASGEARDPKSETPELTPPQAAANRESVPDRQTGSNPLIAQNRVNIDLENYNPLRGAVAVKSPPVLLRTSGNELLIKLPAGSPQGSYEVNLSDPFGRPLRSAKGTSSDRAQLRLKLNLSTVQPGDYLVCLTRETEVPLCIPAVVKAVGRRK